MFISALAAKRIATIVDRPVLEKELGTMEFEMSDWSDSVKTTQLGTALKADYLVIGAFTQLGSSITFNISVRDIKTLTVISSDQRQYTVERVWDNSTGVPGQISTIVNTLSNGLSTEVARREAVRKAQLAQEEKLRAEEEAKRWQESQSLVGFWETGRRRDDGDFIGSNPNDAKNYEYYSLQFSANGSFTAVHDRWAMGGGYPTHIIDQYNGSYIRNGSGVTLTYTINQTMIDFKLRGRWEQQTPRNSSTTNSKTCTVTFRGDGLSISGFNNFPYLYKK
jgi:hypothetical protein